MATNGFLPNSTGAGAVVMSDVAYAASSALALGAQVGELDPDYYNKVNRQSTVIASMIGQFIVDYANVDANDSQSIATLEANFRAALTAYFNSQNTGSTAQSTQAKGNVLFQVTGSGTVTLKPKNGNGVVINGAVIALPAPGISAGVSGTWVNNVAGQALSASTAYYVSIANLSGTPTLRFWTASSYGHMPDTTAGNIGVEVISSGAAPVSTDTLVGLIYLNASSQFQDQDGARYLLSWFNRRAKKSVTNFSADRTTTSTSFVELNSEIRNGFLSWSDETIRYETNGSYKNSVANANTYGVTAVGFDGITPEANWNVHGIGQVANNPISVIVEGFKTGLSEAQAHYATFLGAVQGNTGTWSATDVLPTNSSTGGSAACSLTITVNG